MCSAISIYSTIDSWMRVLLTYPFQRGTPITPSMANPVVNISAGFFLPNPLMSFKLKLFKFIKITAATIKRASFIREWFTRCKILPLTARALWCPSTACIPTPTMMNPICDMDEQAMVFLKLSESIPMIPPRSAVAIPKSVRASPHEK